MIYCAMCDIALSERNISGHTVLFCTTCGSMFIKIDERKYRYAGTTHGNNQLRELLAFIDAKEVKECDSGTQN